MLNKSLLRRSLLLLLALLGTLPDLRAQTTNTAALRAKINEDLRSNSTRQITAEKLRSVFLSSANAIDSIFTTLQMSNGVGTYDASTNTAKLTESGTTFTPTPVATQPNGNYFDIVVPGTQSVTGVAVAMAEGGRLISRGTKWDYIPPGLNIPKGKGVSFLEEITASTNVYDFATASATNGFISTSSGSIGASSPGTYHPSTFIQWGTNTKLKVGLNGSAPSTGAYSALQYDAAMAPITASWSGTSANLLSITKYSGAVYVRVSMREGQQNQLNFGEAVLPYEAYFPTIIKKTGYKDDLGNQATFKPDVQDSTLLATFAQTGGSLMTIQDLDSLKLGVDNGVSFDSDTLASTNVYDFATASATNGFISTSTGSIGTSTPGTYHPSPFITWGANTKLTIGLNGSAPPAGAYSALQYDASHNPIAASWSGTNANLSSITKYSGAVYIRVSMREGQQDQLNFGNSILPYQAYFAPVVTKTARQDASGNLAFFKPDVNDESLLEKVAEKSYLNSSIKQQNGVWAAYTVITVKKDGTGNFTSLMAATASITDASPSKRYLVQVYDNHTALVKTDYTAVPSISGYYALLHVKDYVKIMGMGEMKTIYAELPNNLLLADYTNYETCHFDGFGEIENLRIVAKNVRYAVHYEQSNGLVNQNAILRAKNCIIEHLGSLDVPVAQRWTATDAWGAGTTSGTQFHIEGVQFIGARYGLRAHGNTLSNLPNLFKLKNGGASTKTADGVAVNIDNLGMQQKRFVEMEGFNIQGSFVASNDVYTATLINKAMPSIKITGSSNPPFLFVNAQNVGSVLKVVSNNIGATSYVKVVQDDAGLFGSTNERAGSLGLSGYIFGDNELIAAGTDKRNIIGHRLGDCTSTPKVLVLNINGTNRTVTFSQNYSNGNYTADPTINATTILAEINSQLSGFAVASYYQVNLDYYPELSDVLVTKGNTSTTAFIPKGSFVKFVGMNQCRIAVADETPDGMAIDDIPVSSTIMQMGRIIRHCIVQKTGLFSPRIKAGSETFPEGQVFKISANGELEIDTVNKTGFARALDATRILLQ